MATAKVAKPGFINRVLTGAARLAEQARGGTTSADNQPKAEREAKGQHRKARRNAIRLKLNCIGDPGVNAKSIIEVKGLGARLSGNYYVENAKHTVGDGYRMTLTIRRDGTTRRRRPGATLSLPTACGSSSTPSCASGRRRST